MRVLLAGGGSAGHTSPLLATADALTRLAPGVEITCLGTRERIEAQIIPAAGYPLEFVPSVPLPRRPNADLARLPGRLRAARRAALEVVDRIRPDVVCGFGGFVSVPAYLAARKRHVPLVVHEGNTLPGVANKLGARFTDHVATSFPDTPLPHATYVGLPIRRMIATLDRAAHRAEALTTYGLRDDLPVLLVTGGSQGAASINRAVLGAAEAFAQGGVQVLHVTGTVPHDHGTGDRRALRRPGLRRPDGPRLLRRRRGAVPVGLQHRHRGLRCRAAGGVRAAADRQRRAGPERPGGDRGRWRAAGRRRRPDPGLGHEPASCLCCRTPSVWRVMGAAAAHLIPLDADEKLARMILDGRFG